MEHSLRKITFVGNEEITQPHKRTQMNLLSKFEEYMYFDIYIVAIFKAWQVIIHVTGKCLTILIQWMDVNISLPSNYTEGNFSMYLKHFTLILGKIILDKKKIKVFSKHNES